VRLHVEYAHSISYYAGLSMMPAVVMRSDRPYTESKQHTDNFSLQKLKTFYFSLAFDCILHRFYVTIVMHLRSYSSGGTTKFLTWTWTWTQHWKNQ